MRLFKPKIKKLKNGKDIASLIKTLYDKDYEVRDAAAKALGEIGDSSSVSELVKALKDEKRSMRISAAKALGKIGKPAVKSLLSCMDNKNPKVRVAILVALGKIGDKKTADQIAPLLKDKNIMVQSEAAKALSMMGDKRGINNFKKQEKKEKKKFDKPETQVAQLDKYTINDIEYKINLTENEKINIFEAIELIEAQVHIEPDYINIKSTGSKGEIMEAVEKLKATFELHLENPILHYAYASALDLAAQHKTAKDEMQKCLENHPNFILAKLAIDGWDNLRSLFTLPPWSIDTSSVHPAISQIVKTCILLSTRDNIIPRATLFFRDSQNIFQNIQALRSARIEIASVISPVTNPQVIGIYAKVFDDPVNPFSIECLEIPFRQRGDSTRCRYEYFCIQKEINLVIIDENNNIMLNKRLPISKKMRNVNRKIFNMFMKSNGKSISNSQLMEAIISHQQKIDPVDVDY